MKNQFSNFKLLCLLLVVTALVPTRASAAEVTHKHAIQWLVAPQRVFTGYSAVAYERVVNNSWRWRLGVELQLENSSQNDYIQYNQPNFNEPYLRASDDSGPYEIGFSFLVFKFRPIGKKMNLLYGGGVLYSRHSSDRIRGQSYSVMQSSQALVWSAGPAVKVGVDYQFTQQLAMMVEYGWQLEYTESTSEIRYSIANEYNYETFYRTIQFNRLLARIGLRYSF